MKIGDPWADTPKVSEAWQGMTDTERILKLGVVSQVTLSASAKGVVLVKMPDMMNSGEMGQFLRDMQASIREWTGEPLEVYLPPTQDKNPLRKLRGVKVAE